jgi:hypothetical protein
MSFRLSDNAPMTGFSGGQCFENAQRTGCNHRPLLESARSVRTGRDSGFPLADGGAIDGHVMWGHIFDLQAAHLAAAQLAVDGLNMAKKLTAATVPVEYRRLAEHRTARSNIEYPARRGPRPQPLWQQFQEIPFYRHFRRVWPTAATILVFL